MRDTRLLQAAEALRAGHPEEALELIAELLAEGVDNVEERVALLRAEKLGMAASHANERDANRMMRDAAQAIMAIHDTEKVKACGVPGGFSTHCTMWAGHTGKHRDDRGFEWDNASQARFAAEMLSKGRLD